MEAQIIMGVITATAVLVQAFAHVLKKRIRKMFCLCCTVDCADSVRSIPMSTPTHATSTGPNVVSV